MELNTPSTAANAASTSKSVPSVSASSILSEDTTSDWNPQEERSNTGKESSKKRKKRNSKLAPGTHHRSAMLTPSPDDPDINALFKTTVSEVDGQRIFTCLECRYEFFTPYNARRHSNVHLRASRTECKVCGESLSGPLSLAAHKKEHERQEKDKTRQPKSNKRNSKSSAVPVKDTAAESLIAPDTDTPKRDQPEKNSKKKSLKKANEDGTEVKKEAKDAAAAAPSKKELKRSKEGTTTEVKKEAEDAVASTSKKVHKKTKEETTEDERKVEEAVAVPSKKSHKKKPSADVDQTDPASAPITDGIPINDAAESMTAPDYQPVARASKSERSSSRKFRKKATEDETEVKKEAEDAAVAAPSKKELKRSKEETTTEVAEEVETTVTAPSKKCPKKKSSADGDEAAASVPAPSLAPDEAPAPDELAASDATESAAALDSMPGVVMRTSKSERGSSKKSLKKANEDETEVKKEAEDAVAAPSKKSHRKAKEEATEIEKKVEDAVAVPSKKRHKKKPSADVDQTVDAVADPASAPITDGILINDVSEGMTAPDYQPVTRPSKSVRSSSKKSRKRATEDETEVKKEEAEGTASDAHKDLKSSKEETTTEVSYQVETTVTAPSKKCLKKKSSADGDEAAESVSDTAPALAPGEIPAPDELPATGAPESAAALDSTPKYCVVTRTSKSERSWSNKSLKKADEDETDEVAREAEDAVALPSKRPKLTYEGVVEVAEGAESKKKAGVDPAAESAEDTVAASFSEETVAALFPEDTVADPIPAEMPSNDSTESAIAPVSLLAFSSPGGSDGSLSEGVNEVVRGVHESFSLEEMASMATSREALLGSTPGSLSVSSMSEMSVIESEIEDVAVRVGRVEKGAVATAAIIRTETAGDAMDAPIVVPPKKEEHEMPILMHLMQQDDDDGAPESAAAADQVESKEMKSDGDKESLDEQMSSDVLEVLQRVVDGVSFIAAEDEHPCMDVAYDDSVVTIEAEPVIPTAAAAPPATATKKEKKKRNRMVGYQLIEVAEEPPKVCIAATRTREEEEQPSGSRPSASQERRSTRIQMRMAMEASAVEEARRCTRTRKVTPPPIYPSNIEKVREAKEMEREMKESREMARRALAQLPHASKRARASTDADGTSAAPKRATKRSSRAGSSSRASSSHESLYVARREAAAAAGLIRSRHDASTAAAPSPSNYYDPRWSRRAPSSTSLLVSSSPSTSSSLSRPSRERATPQPPTMPFRSLSARGAFTGRRPPSLCNASLYPRAGAICGPRIHRHQPMLSAPARVHFPAPLTALFLSTIFHPAWMRPTQIGDDEKAAIARRGHAHLMLPVRMYRTETLIERCLQALEETSIPLPPLQPLLPAPCRLLADGCSDPLSDVLKFVPRVPTGPAPFASHRVQSFAEARYTMASEGARNHVFSKSEDRKWWEVRTFPSFDGLSFHGHRPPLPTSARRSEDGLWRTVADKNKTGDHNIRLTKCTYVTSKKPVFSVHESMPLLRAAPPAPYSTPSVYSTPAASPYVAAPHSIGHTTTTSSYGAWQNQASRPPASSMRPQPSAARSSSSFSVMTLTMPRPADVPSTSSPSSSTMSDRQAMKRAADSPVASMVKRIKSSFQESYPGRPTERPLQQSQPLQQQQSVQHRQQLQHALPPLQLQPVQQQSVQQRQQQLPHLQLQPMQSQQHVQQPPMSQLERAYYEYDGPSGVNSLCQVAPSRPEVITVEEDGTTFTVL